MNAKQARVTALSIAMSLIQKELLNPTDMSHFAGDDLSHNRRKVSDELLKIFENLHSKYERLVDNGHQNLRVE